MTEHGEDERKCRFREDTIVTVERETVLAAAVVARSKDRVQQCNGDKRESEGDEMWQIVASIQRFFDHQVVK